MKTSSTHRSLCGILTLEGKLGLQEKDESTQPVSTDVTTYGGMDPREHTKPGICPAGECVIAQSAFCRLSFLQTPGPSTHERVLHEASGLHCF